MEKDYKKLGGWLIFFIVSCVISLLLAITTYITNVDAFDILSSMGDEFAMIALLTRIAVFVLVVGVGSGIVALVMKNKKLLTIYFIFIAISAMLTIITAFIYPTYLGEAIASERTKIIITCIRDFVVLAAWFRYFKVSKRVAVYFGDVEHNNQISNNENTM